jgi:hypothetical protein
VYDDRWRGLSGERKKGCLLPRDSGSEAKEGEFQTSGNVGPEKIEGRMKKVGDFTKRERDIREALFSVFYESDWHLTFRHPRADSDDARWKFVDKVIDRLRADDAKKRRKKKSA